MTRVLLVDGSSFLYRAYYAMPSLQAPDGHPSGAIYGLMTMVENLINTYPSDYIICIFDAKGKTFRHTMYPDYKAHRPAMPENLAMQIDLLHQCIAEKGWPILMESGVEADDVIGALSHQAVEQGYTCLIASGDKDLAQLVGEHVFLLNSASGVCLNSQGVLEKFGVLPERMVDYLTLVGDTADNIPGVKKVGPKTAAKLLKQYGSLDEILKHKDDIPGTIGQNIRDSLETIALSRRLVTLKTDLDFDWESLKSKPTNLQALSVLYDRLGFRSLLSALQVEKDAREQDQQLSQAQRCYQAIQTEAALIQWLEQMQSASIVAIDTETTSLDIWSAQLVGLSFSIVPQQAVYIPVGHDLDSGLPQLERDLVLKILQPWLEDAQCAKVGHHLKYDSHILANYGITLRGIIADTLLASYILDSQQKHDLASLALRTLGLQVSTYESVCGQGKSQISFDQVPIEQATQYAAEDADVTLQLHIALSKQLAYQDKMNALYQNIEVPLQDVIAQIERNGVLIDAEALSVYGVELAQALTVLEAQVHEEAGEAFNLNSPKQLQEICFGKMGWPVVKKTAQGVPSTDESVLEALSDRYAMAKALLRYRMLAKLKSGYADKLPGMVNEGTQRIHTTYMQSVVVTGRLSSARPNLQNIPVRMPEGRKIREMFIAPKEHYLVSCDYTQIELRMMAEISRDIMLCQDLAHGTDIHVLTASQIFGCTLEQVSEEQRRCAKTINFGLIYGMSEYGLAKNLGVSVGVAKEYILQYFSRYEGVFDYMQQAPQKAKELGYTETIFGRKMYLRGSSSRGKSMHRSIINAPIQGSASDLMKIAMLKVHAWLMDEALSSKIVMQVHDELVFEVPKAELDQVLQQVTAKMTEIEGIEVPLEVNIGYGENWEQSH